MYVYLVEYKILYSERPDPGHVYVKQVFINKQLANAWIEDNIEWMASSFEGEWLPACTARPYWLKQSIDCHNEPIQFTMRVKKQDIADYWYLDKTPITGRERY